jgi:hypothetical protein
LHGFLDSADRSFYGFEPLPARGTAVSNELMDKLREEVGE